MEFREIANSIQPLNDDQFSLLEGITELIEVPKNHTLIYSDKTSPYIYFQKEGICRIYYHKEEKEIILGFTFPGEVLISLNSYIHQKPGYETIQTLEKSSVYRIHTLKLLALYESHTMISNWGRRLAELEALKIEERLMLRLFKSSHESYEELLKKAPNITNRIKLGYIASYLGISQVTLSRIRGIKK
ncbi:hypothetical protein CHU00_10750 [Sphingobacterium cellulitidis]|uniref:Crp/Fnr family transcriptional regulator n=1 Tax=Sphingobacterium cellulitidis TaxID=1768011 RepID=UPI000B9436EE|nr:Crp/Fnr family transcriptional regulator [Sphingobacterium cellulitidis]OYD41666.1 hypothetical protein CHT99_13490 [Sphingobacterium cellulitidis]OYD45810.1 hypothetical protein CHU00_10750 [Sphingobacterium cellulitidis]